MTSAHFEDLENSIGMLRSHLLPEKFDPTGDYIERVFTGVISFRVLCHAAIEDYFERRAIEIAKKAARRCKDTGTVSHSAACLVSFCETHFGQPPATLKPPQNNQNAMWPERIDMKARVSKAAGNFINHLSQYNHGIREENLLKILIPIGYPHDRIDEFMISQLDNFGKLRGEFAHSSAASHITRKPNPEVELNRVNDITGLLTQVDIDFDELLYNIK